MTGDLIQFERRRDSGKGELYRQRPVPRGPISSEHKMTVIELRVARIARLLNELEELTRVPKNVPTTTRDQARAGVEKARGIIRRWSTAQHDLQGAPQPELDDERIERMYRELNQGA